VLLRSGWLLAVTMTVRVHEQQIVLLWTLQLAT
jgi:hypothetical protein